MNIKLPTERPLEFLSLKEADRTCLSLFMSKCHTIRKSHVVTHMRPLRLFTIVDLFLVLGFRRCIDAVPVWHWYDTYSTV